MLYTIETNHRVGLYCAQRDQGGQWWRRTDITRSYTFLICSQTPLIFLLDTLSSRTPHLHCSIVNKPRGPLKSPKQAHCSPLRRKIQVFPQTALICCKNSVTMLHAARPYRKDICIESSWKPSWKRL